MSFGAVEAQHSLRSIQEMLGLSRSAIARMIELGFVNPARGPRDALLFSFRDVVLLRTASELQEAKIPTRRILKSLEQLRKSLPAEAPLSGLRITAVGDRVAVRDRDSMWEAESGQVLIDFDVAVRPGIIEFAKHAESLQRSGPLQDRETAADSISVEALYEHAEDIEGSDPKAAESAFRRVIELSPTFANAYANLSAMLCDAHRCDDAVRVLSVGLAHCPDSALLYYNLGVALEDLKRHEAAIESYETALKLDPGIDDAHYNVGRIYDAMGNTKAALRHYSAYRRMQR